MIIQAANLGIASMTLAEDAEPSTHVIMRPDMEAHPPLQRLFEAGKPGVSLPSMAEWRGSMGASCMVPDISGGMQVVTAGDDAGHSGCWVVMHSRVFLDDFTIMYFEFVFDLMHHAQVLDLLIDNGVLMLTDRELPDAGEETPVEGRVNVVPIDSNGDQLRELITRMHQHVTSAMARDDASYRQTNSA